MARNKAPAINFKPGDKVQVHFGGTWRDAVILHLARYRGGYEYQYDPLPKRINSYDPLPSTGGWTCDTFCRPRDRRAA